MTNESKVNAAKLYGADAAEWLSRWDSGRSVWSIEMGGLGPGYEQAIQITVAEIVRWLLTEKTAVDDMRDKKKWAVIAHAMDEAVMERPPVRHVGLSGAQWGAAMQVATHLYMNGPPAVFADERVKDRHIQVSRNFPTAEAVTST